MSDQKTEVAAGSGYAGPACSAVLAEIVAEVERATRKFPNWPNDPLHALSVLGEEYGELTKEVVQLCYEPRKTTLEKVRTEAIQTAAMALRFLISLDRYEFHGGIQHEQNNRVCGPKPSAGSGTQDSVVGHST